MLAAGYLPTNNAWLDSPVESGMQAGFGVYVHVPFCVHRCGYCDFATEAVANPADANDLFDRYVTALTSELTALATGAIDPRLGVTRWPKITSVFVGGGTPTILPPQQLADVIGHVCAVFDVTEGCEITVECNPETASAPLFDALFAAGVNRVSFGAQSFTPSVLATLERRHTAGSVPTAVALARQSGITDISVDLLYGTPGETDNDFRHSLERAIALGVTHVSAYALTVHENTPFGRQVATGVLPAPDPDVQRDRFELAQAVLGAAGFEAYELSNFARGPAYRSAHNTLYWRHGNYLGAGVGAHSHVNGHRWWATRSTPGYLQAWENASLDAVPFTNWPGRSGYEALDVDERALERLMLGLRVAEGIHPHDLPPLSPDALEEAMRLGLVETACGRVRSTSEGWFLLDEAVRVLFV
ncbi:MAG: radical SAM family heme chaperone HemW [Nitriliruptoraceae bacterium]